LTEKKSQEESKQLPVEIVAPISIDRLAEAFQKFQEFKGRLLSKDDSISIAGRQYLKKSAWRKWALACAVSDELLSYERIPPQGKDSEGNFQYRVVARALHKPTGRSSVGVAVASRAEKENWAHEEHDIFALAHTRAKNRAIADLVGGGEVSAEEMVSEAVAEPVEPQPPTPVEKPIETTVPITKEPIAQPSIKQFPLIEGTKAIGMLNVSTDGREATLVPEKPVNSEDPAIKSFLVPRIFDALKQKYSDFQYALRTESSGYITAILLRGPLDDPHAKEIANAAKWAFLRAWEREHQPDK